MVAALAAIACTAPVPAQAAVRDCNRQLFDGRLTISSARNMKCSSAARDARRINGPISRSFRTPGGFRCTQSSGSSEGGQWRCVRRTRAYRFEFGD